MHHLLISYENSRCKVLFMSVILPFDCYLIMKLFILLQNGSELVRRISAVYCIEAQKDDKIGRWIIDVKNSNGSVHFDPSGTGVNLPIFIML